MKYLCLFNCNIDRSETNRVYINGKKWPILLTVLQTCTRLPMTFDIDAIDWKSQWPEKKKTQQKRGCVQTKKEKVEDGISGLLIQKKVFSPSTETASPSRGGKQNWANSSANGRKVSALTKSATRSFWFFFFTDWNKGLFSWSSEKDVKCRMMHLINAFSESQRFDTWDKREMRLCQWEWRLKVAHEEVRQTCVRRNQLHGAQTRDVTVKLTRPASCLHCRTKMPPTRGVSRTKNSTAVICSGGT